MKEPITASEFERRMAELCLGGFGPSMPRKQRDRHILLKSMALLLGHGREYSEPALNDVLQAWVQAAGPRVLIDHVSLRRYLVEEGYVERDRAGHLYRVCAADSKESLFDAGLEGIDPFRAVSEAIAEREQRRRSHEGEGTSD